MMTSNANTPAQRGIAGGGNENHVGAGLPTSVARDHGNYHDLIRRLVDQAPEFTPEQRSRIAVLLRPATSQEVA